MSVGINQRRYQFIKNHNEQLKIADRFSWETAEAYQRDPFADNPSDEKSLKRAREEGELAEEEKVKLAKSKNSVKKPFRPSLQRALTEGTGFLPSCWRCHRTGHIARFCRAFILGQGPFNNQLVDLGLVMQAPLVHKARHDFKSGSNLMLDEFCHQQDFEFRCFSNVRDKPVTGVLTDSGSKEPVRSSQLFCSDKNKQDFSVPNVKNRLKENIQFWKNIDASPWVINIIEDEYAIPLVEMPPPAFLSNKSAFKAQDFVSLEISELLERGYIKEINHSEARIISLLSVADNGDKLRLILDLRYLNSFISVPKFKYEDIRNIKNMFNKGDFFFKMDIKSGYHHINILEEHQKFLCFSWTVEGVTRYFKFTVLVFGLASAPFLFTKVVKVLIKHWRKMGIGLFAFVDDFFGGSHNFHSTELVAQIVKTDLFKSGFVVNPKKSRWVPTQKDNHLGFIVDLKEGILSVTPARIQELNKLLIFICLPKNCKFGWFSYFHGTGYRSCRQI